MIQFQNYCAYEGGSKSCEPVWPDGKIIFKYLAFTTMKICPLLIIKIAKVGSKSCQILTNPKNIAKYLKQVCQNLVTLVLKHFAVLTCLHIHTDSILKTSAGIELGLSE